MKKKYILLCAAIGALTLVGGLTACKDEPETPAVTAETVCEKLNGFAAKEISSATLNVSVSKGGEELKSQYSLASSDGGYTVSYSYEKINPIAENDGVYTVPADYKTTYTGNMKIVNGAVTSHTGDGSAAEIPTVEKLTASGMKFDTAYFTDFVFDDAKGTVTANVKSSAEFLNQTGFTGTGMKLTLSYGKESITSVKLEYTSANSYQVVASYQFG